MIMDIVDRLKKCMEGNVRTKHNALLACASDEILETLVGRMLTEYHSV